MTDDVHPFGEDRQGRLNTWKAIIAFRHPADPLVQIAKLAVVAAEAKNDDDRARLALFALGLHGNKKVDENEQALRAALAEFRRAYDAVYPPPDDDVDEESGKAMWATAVKLGLIEVAADPVEKHAELLKRETEARKCLAGMCAEGIDLWLYRYIRRFKPGDRPSQFLTRTARAGGTDLLQALEWARHVAKPLKPRKKCSCGRVR